MLACCSKKSAAAAWQLLAQWTTPRAVSCFDSASWPCLRLFNKLQNAPEPSQSWHRTTVVTAAASWRHDGVTKAARLSVLREARAETRSRDNLPTSRLISVSFRLAGDKNGQKTAKDCIKHERLKVLTRELTLFSEFTANKLTFPPPTLLTCWAPLKLSFALFEGGGGSFYLAHHFFQVGTLVEGVRWHLLVVFSSSFFAEWPRTSVRSRLPLQRYAGMSLVRSFLLNKPETETTCGFLKPSSAFRPRPLLHEAANCLKDSRLNEVSLKRCFVPQLFKSALMEMCKKKQKQTPTNTQTSLSSSVIHGCNYRTHHCTPVLTG